MEACFVEGSIVNWVGIHTVWSRNDLLGSIRSWIMVVLPFCGFLNLFRVAGFRGARKKGGSQKAFPFLNQRKSGTMLALKGMGTRLSIEKGDRLTKLKGDPQKGSVDKKGTSHKHSIPQQQQERLNSITPTDNSKGINSIRRDVFIFQQMIIIFSEIRHINNSSHIIFTINFFCQSIDII